MNFFCLWAKSLKRDDKPPHTSYLKTALDQYNYLLPEVIGGRVDLKFSSTTSNLFVCNFVHKCRWLLHLKLMLNISNCLTKANSVKVVRRNLKKVRVLLINPTIVMLFLVHALYH